MLDTPIVGRISLSVIINLDLYMHTLKRTGRKGDVEGLYRREVVPSLCCVG